MINKQNLWFLTLFSLILVLSVYYITMPNDLLIASNYTTNEKTETKEETKDQETVCEADNLTALRVSLDEERDKEKEELFSMFDIFLDNIENSYISKFKILYREIRKEIEISKKILKYNHSIL